MVNETVYIELKVCYTNVHSLLDKVTELEYLLETENSCVIAILETWLTSGICDVVWATMLNLHSLFWLPEKPIYSPFFSHILTLSVTRLSTLTGIT